MGLGTRIGYGRSSTLLMLHAFYLLRCPISLDAMRLCGTMWKNRYGPGLSKNAKKEHRYGPGLSKNATKERK
ncbi:UNVERIFIED_CONTAM: hypothetical protein Sradi_5745800 [Sesamum radiatum]|uniref:Secreted protein n=1 Tax=Sesamum radiatum TaxID=300843 RepID=A0AAW2L5B5_SESRA